MVKELPIRQLYRIHHKKLELDIALADVRKLYPHEETSPEFVDKLMKRMEKEGNVKHPALIDRNTQVILDGTHRFTALKKLGCRWMPVCLMDYKNPAIRINCWYRTVANLESKKQLFNMLKRLKLNINEVGKKAAESAVKSGSAPTAILTKQNGFTFKSKPLGLRQKYRLIKRIEEALKKTGAIVEYKYPSDAKLSLKNGLIDAVIVVPQIDKRSVVKAALARKVFTMKATRHIIPARILNLYIPLYILKNKNLTEANAQVTKLLRENKPKFLPAGSVVGGRRYEEEVYIFE